MTEQPLAPKKLMLVLGAVVFGTAAILMVLALIPKTTLVELTVNTRRISFRLIPDITGGSFNPLHGGLKIHAMEVKEPDFVTARWEAFPGGTFQVKPYTTVSLQCAQPCRPVLKLFGSADMDIRVHRQQRLTVAVEMRSDTRDSMWQGWADAPTSLKTSQALVAVTDIASAIPVGDWIPLGQPSRVRLAGGKAESLFGLHLAGALNEPDSRLEVIDLNTGQTTVQQDFDLRLPDSPTIIPHQDRLIVIEQNSSANRGIQLLRRNTDVINPRFFWLTGRQEQSFVSGGSIRFPAKERDPISIDPDAFIRIDDDTPLKLKSMVLSDDQLKLVLWGRPASVETGPSAGLLSQQLPSLLLWAYTHRSGMLMFSILGWLLGSTIAALRLFGWVAK